MPGQRILQSSVAIAKGRPPDVGSFVGAGGAGTGLYVSPNCDYAWSSVTGADAALLDGVGGDG